MFPLTALPLRRIRTVGIGVAFAAALSLIAPSSSAMVKVPLRSVASRSADRSFDPHGFVADLIQEALKIEKGTTVSDFALDDIVAAQQATGDLKAAQRMAERIHDKFSRWQRFDSLAADQAKAGNIDAAKQAYAEYLQAKGPHPFETQSHNGFHYRSHAAQEIALTEFRSGDLIHAIQTVTVIDDWGDREEAISALASAQAEAGDIPGAKQTADLMHNYYSKQSIFCSIATIQAKKGDFTGATQTAEAFSETNSYPDAFENIASLQIKAHDIDGAEKTAKKISESNSKIEVLLQIAGARFADGNRTAAAEKIEEAHRIAATIPGDFAQESQSKIAIAEVQEGDVMRAKQTVADSHFSVDWLPKALCNVGVAQAQSGDMAGAMQTLGEARDAAGKIDNPDSRNDALTEIAVEQAKAGNVEEARQTVRDFPDLAAKTKALAEVASACAASGAREDAEATFDMAFHTALRLHELMPEIRALDSLTTEEAEPSYVTGAKATLAAMRKSSVQIKESGDASEASDEIIHAMTDIALAQWRSGDETGAKTTLNDARKMAEGFPEAEGKISNLMDIAQAVVEASRPAQR